ncbi:MAG: hypothetical protein EBV20_02030 [Betaproteobacteria bacterium]|nr:hypothetical protein [Betaproteobacteria bacterium]
MNPKSALVTQWVRLGLFGIEQAAGADGFKVRLETGKAHKGQFLVAGALVTTMDFSPMVGMAEGAQGQVLASRLDLEAEGGVEAASHFEVGHLKNNTI